MQPLGSIRFCGSGTRQEFRFEPEILAGKLPKALAASATIESHSLHGRCTNLADRVLLFRNNIVEIQVLSAG